MTESPYPFDFSKLGVAERLALVDDLWDSVAADADAARLPAAQSKELSCRLDALEAGVMPPGDPWHQVKQSLDTLDAQATSEEK
jgi:putative addiction module component (TIGR02574 family)